MELLYGQGQGIHRQQYASFGVYYLVVPGLDEPPHALDRVLGDELLEPVDDD